MKKMLASLGLVCVSIFMMSPVAGATSTGYTDHNRGERCDTVDADGNMDDLCPPEIPPTTPPTVLTTVPPEVPTKAPPVVLVPPGPSVPPKEMPNTGGEEMLLGLIGAGSVSAGYVMVKKSRKK